MRVAITGASGFVGRNLLANLDDSGFELVPVSRRRVDSQSWRASPPLEADTAPENWAHAFAGVDAVVHCAARSHVFRERETDPLDVYRRINRDGATAMARGAALAGVRRIVFLSSVKVLGETTTGRRPFCNEDQPAPSDPYAISKAEAEADLEALSQELGFELVVLRPPLVYGPGVGGNIASLLGLIRRGLWLPLGSARHNRRSLISTSNLADAVKAALVAPKGIEGRFLVSDDDDLSTRDLVEALARATGRKPRLIPAPLTIMRVFLSIAGRSAVWSRLFGDLQVDIAETRKRLDWQPRLSAADGLARVTAVPEK